jgi:hypothetical protein
MILASKNVPRKRTRAAVATNDCGPVEIVPAASKWAIQDLNL